jgi:hypothetical protein
LNASIASREVVSKFFSGFWRLGNRYKIFYFLEGWGFNLGSLNFWKTLFFGRAGGLGTSLFFWGGGGDWGWDISPFLFCFGRVGG